MSVQIARHSASHSTVSEKRPWIVLKQAYVALVGVYRLHSFVVVCIFKFNLFLVLYNPLFANMGENPGGYCPIFGNYPREYNRKVHGPYYPWVNYGPRDTQFKDVKLGELKGWFARRNKTPQAAFATISRSYFNWHRTWLNAKFGSPMKGIFQSLFFLSCASLLSSYGLIKQHRNHKYHW